MPGTVTTTAKRDPLGDAEDSTPLRMILATLTGGQAGGVSTTTRIGVSDAVEIPAMTRELVLHYKVTAAATDATDLSYALLELNYQDVWVPVLSTTSILGNATEPILVGSSLQVGAGTGGKWTYSSATAIVHEMVDGKQIPGGAKQARIAFYVTADGDGVQDDSFTGTAELWAI